MLIALTSVVGLISGFGCSFCYQLVSTKSLKFDSISTTRCCNINQLHGEGFSQEAERLETELQAVMRAEAAPLAVARRWARLPPERCLDWLYRRTAAEARRRAIEAANRGTAPLQNGPDVLNISRLFEALRELGELRRLTGAGLNAELGLARLLNSWYGEANTR